MDEGTIIPVPPDYQLPDAGKALLGKVQGMDFQQQIDYLRGTVLEMGAEAAPGLAFKNRTYEKKPRFSENIGSATRHLGRNRVFSRFDA